MCSAARDKDRASWEKRVQRMDDRDLDQYISEEEQRDFSRKDLEFLKRERARRNEK